MAFTNSKFGRQTLADILGNTTQIDLDSDTIKVALYGNTGTPDQNATAANFAYNAGQWVTANEVSQTGQWAAGGVALASKVLDVSTSAVVMFDAADTASGAAATLTGVYGAFPNDTTITTPVANQGLCFNYLGGSNSVTAGTFTVVWNVLGIARFTL